MYIRLNQNIILDITEEVTAREMNTSPLLYLYDFTDGQTRKPFYEIFQEDNLKKESRINGFSKLHDNLILNPTPNFYYQDKGYVVGDFHTLKRIDNVLTETISSLIQFRKVRILFTSGFGYTPQLGEQGTAATTLRIYSENDNKIINLLQYIDYYDSSNIQPIVPILFENQEFNTGINLEIIDIEYLFASSSADLVELRNLLFGTEKPNFLFVELTQPASTEIVDTTINSKQYKKITPSEISQGSFKLGMQDDDLFLNLSFEDRKLNFQLKHKRFDTKAFLEKNYKENINDNITIYYDITLQYYNVSNELIESKYYRLSNITNVFDEINFIPTIQNQTTDHILCTIKGIMVNSSSIRIERHSSVVIDDVSTLKTQDLNINLTSEKVYSKIERNYTTLQNDLTVPNVVYSTKNIYLQSQNSNEILLQQAKQTIVINTETDMSSLKNTKLKIGSKIFYSTKDNKTFELTEDTYYTTDTKYYVLDLDDNLITSGEIKK